MNSCVLMAQVIRDPELRSTQDGMAVADIIVEFAGLRDDDPMATVKVVGWGNLAEEIKSKYSHGDQVIIEGRLAMNLIDMPDGYKEKRAELVASKIFPVGSQVSNQNNTGDWTANSLASYQPEEPSNVPSASQPEPANTGVAMANPNPTPPETANNEDWDEIPFRRLIYSRISYGTEMFDDWELAANGYWQRLK